MLLIFRSLRNPSPEQIDFIRRERMLVRGRGRHLQFRIVRKNSLDHKARIRFARLDSDATVSDRRRSFKCIEAKHRFAFLFIEAVARIASIRKNRSNIRIEGKLPRWFIPLRRNDAEYRREDYHPLKAMSANHFTSQVNIIELFRSAEQFFNKRKGMALRKQPICVG